MKHMRLLWKEKVIVSYLEKYPYTLPPGQLYSSERSGVKEFDFITHLIFKRHALMPATYYIGAVIPVFSQKISLRYHKYLEYLIRKAITDGFIDPIDDPTIKIGTKRRLRINDKGREFITLGGYIDQVALKKEKTITLSTGIFAALGGIGLIILIVHEYGIFISWLAWALGY